MRSETEVTRHARADLTRLRQERDSGDERGSVGGGDAPGGDDDGVADGDEDRAHDDDTVGAPRGDHDGERSDDDRNADRDDRASRWAEFLDRLKRAYEEHKRRRASAD